MVEFIVLFGKFNEVGTIENIICQALGYIGMALVLLSFTFKNVKKIRLTNMIGSIITIVYASLDTQIPTLCLNIGLLIINAIYLIIALKNNKKNDSIEQNKDNSEK